MINNHKKIVIWGFGLEGKDTLHWLQQCRFKGEIHILDDGLDPSQNDDPIPNLFYTRNVEILGKLDNDDLVIKTPGISGYRSEYKALQQRNIKISSNTDLALSNMQQHTCIGVTGTKGKSTSVAMIAHIFKHANINAIICGNFGVPMLGQIANAPAGTVFIIELSSYQIFDLQNFPAIRLLTNISQDHLDWHESIENYQADKLRLITEPKSGISFINAADQLSIDRTDNIENLAFYNTPQTIHFADDSFYSGDVKLKTDDSFKNEPSFYLSNICGTMSVAAILGVDLSAAIQSMISFKGLEHRQEIIGQKHGIQFVNDSISTVPVAALAAIERFSPAPIKLILGGYDRGVDYLEFVQKLIELPNVNSYCYSPAGKRMWQALKKNTPNCFYNDDFEITVKQAITDAVKGDVVILSPAAASYNDFKNFQQRGNLFKQLCDLPS